MRKRVGALGKVRAIPIFVLKLLTSFSGNKSPTPPKSVSSDKDGAQVEGKHQQAFVLSKILYWTFLGASKKRQAMTDDASPRKRPRDTVTLRGEEGGEQNPDMPDTQGIVSFASAMAFSPLRFLSQSPCPSLRIYLLPNQGIASPTWTLKCLLRRLRNTSWPSSMMTELILRFTPTSFKHASKCSMLVEASLT